jgi:hypothetical protein
MATFFLVNTVVVAGTKIFAGDTINDAVDDAPAIVAAGGLLWPSSDTVVAAAAARAVSARINRGANEETVDAIMQAAVDALQKTEQRGTAVLVAGVSAAIAATITANSRIIVTPKDKGASATIGRLEAPSADRVVGAPGSFVVRSFTAAGAAENADVSTFDWHAEG